jgi:hypothetical protein
MAGTVVPAKLLTPQGCWTTWLNAHLGHGSRLSRESLLVWRLCGKATEWHGVAMCDSVENLVAD